MLAPNLANPTLAIDMLPDEKTGDSLTITKRLDQPWAIGSGNGGLDTGSVAANVTYFGHLITNFSVSDLLISASPINPVIPTGWTWLKRRGAFLTDTNGHIIGFRQDGTRFMYTAGNQVLAVDGGPVQGPNYPQFLRNLPGLPIGIKVTAIFGATMQGPNESYFGFFDPDRGYPNLADWRYATGRRVTGGEIWGMFECGVNTAGQMWTGDQFAGSLLILVVHGWIDEAVLR